MNLIFGNINPVQIKRGLRRTSKFFFGFHKSLGISVLAKQLLVFQEVLCSMELVIDPMQPYFTSKLNQTLSLSKI